jgi:hypothetical protein
VLCDFDEGFVDCVLRTPSDSPSRFFSRDSLSAFSTRAMYGVLLDECDRSRFPPCGVEVEVLLCEEDCEEAAEVVCIAVGDGTCTSDFMIILA